MAQRLYSPLTKRAAEIVAHAISALGKENALAWLEKTNQPMDGKTPLEILGRGDPAKLDQLDEQVTATEYGMYL
jgi:hypothetical protein